MPRTQTSDVQLGELLRLVAREKEIDEGKWVTAIEDAMASAAKKQHRIKEPVRAHVTSASAEVTRNPLSASSLLISPKNASSEPIGLPVFGSIMPLGCGATRVVLLSVNPIPALPFSTHK